MSSNKTHILKDSFFSHILPHLKFHLHICTKLGSCPLRWDPTTQRVLVDTTTITFQRLHHWHMNLYIMAQVWGLTRYWKSLSFAQLMISMYFVVGSILFQIARRSVTLNTLEMVRTLNGISLLEKSLLAMSPPSKYKYQTLAKWLMIIGTVTACMLPAILICYVVNPCFLPSWGAFVFLDENGRCHLQVSWIVWLLMAFEFYAWFNTTFVAMFGTVHFFGMGLNFIIHSLCRLKR